MADALHRLVEGNKYLSGVLSADRKSGKIDEYMADGFRGRPDVDLAAWAKGRGLRDIGNRLAMGYMGAFTWSEDCQFNVVRGRLPGGEEGVLYHEARPLDDAGTPGLFYGKKVDDGGPSWWKPDFNIKRQLDHMLPFGFGGQFAFFLSPFTTASVRIPEGVGTLSGLYVARTFERYPKDDEVWEARRLEADGLPDWIAGRRRRGSDEKVFADVVRGPIRELLQRELGLGFEIRFEFGQLVVSQQHWLKQEHELDAFAELTSWLARRIRQICAAAQRPQPFDVRLGEPWWLDPVRQKPGGVHIITPPGAEVGQVASYATQQGLVLEDPFEFHRAFGDVGLPGEAFAVLRGTLPGTARDGRLVVAAERQMKVPKDLEKRVKNPGGPAGQDVALIPVRADAAETTEPDGEKLPDGSGRFVVRRGLLAAWRVREQWNLMPAALETLGRDTVSFAESRGLLPA